MLEVDSMIKDISFSVVNYLLDLNLCSYSLMEI